MSRVTLSRENDVWILTMTSSETSPGVFENRLSPEFMDDFMEALDTVEKAPGSAALVTTSKGKIFCNGLDLQWLGEHPKDTEGYMAKFHKLLFRLLFFPVPTIAAINGHAFAGGCLLAMAHDFRIMRAERGFLCMNEIELGAALPPGANALLMAKVDHVLLRDVLLLGHRYPAEEALKARLIDAIAPYSEVLAEATKRANALASKGANRAVYKKMKVMLYPQAHAVLKTASQAPSQKDKGKTKTETKLPRSGGRHIRKSKTPRITKHVPIHSKL